MNSLHAIAEKLLTPPKGILAADESLRSAAKRLEAVGVEATEETRRQYRELFITTPKIGQYLNGIILFEETVRQQTSGGESFLNILKREGVLPGIKVDQGTTDDPASKGEGLTNGLDDLEERLKPFVEIGCLFTKWRTVQVIGESIPTEQNMLVNAAHQAAYAKIAQDTGLVPIVEPEVLIKGSHTIERSEGVTTRTLTAVFNALTNAGVDLTGMILKSSMVLAGSEAPTPSSPEEVAEATVRCFTASVPKELPGIVFLSGGQTPVQATANLNAIHQLGGQPWTTTFSFARALQGPPLEIWRGNVENISDAQKAFIARLRLNVSANRGVYTPDMEK